MNIQKSANIRWYLISSYFLITLVCAILYTFDPASSSGIYPPSLTRTLGGFYCAGCGTLRGLHQILHGNFKAAWALNPLLILGLPYLIYWLIAVSLQFWRKFKLPIIIWHKPQIIGMSIVILSYSLLRNINHEWFRWLVPH